MAVECTFSKAGIPCPLCSIMGIPDYKWNDLFFFTENLRRQHDLYLLDEHNSLVCSMQDNHLAPALFKCEFEHMQNWFYASTQGRITRFLVHSFSVFIVSPSSLANSSWLAWANSRATHNITVQGYHLLATTSTDTSLLLYFIALGTESHIHPLVLQVVMECMLVIIMSTST
ncbi:hypothetical protein K438DRAFT_1983029 [Mycena galopus ATCC 62051]|nr:hypothetical protein K438DRAFT_1983029 [Mycena galopus ATCC 62051]